jgi:thiol-disulfide isomerase/thioredoxin
MEREWPPEMAAIPAFRHGTTVAAPIARRYTHIMTKTCLPIAALALLLVSPVVRLSAQERVVHVELEYRSPQEGQPKPNFSPKGMQVLLAPVRAAVRLPPGAIRPAKSGLIKVGPDRKSWIPVLATAGTECRKDLCQLYLDRNRNGNFRDDGPALTGVPAQNAKTRAWWTSINKVELSVPYSATRAVEPYLVNFWIVREDSAATPDILRFSTGSWRYGTTTVNGVPALVAAMDADNNALFNKDDMWSVLGASEPKADQMVLSIGEAKPLNRLMFVPRDSGEFVLEFRSFSPDGRSLNFAVVDRPVTKLADRAPDDLLRDERPRPRATAPFVWAHGKPGFDAAMARARASGKKVILDFEATWCGPCHVMDQWIWNDAEVAGALNAGYLGVKIDVDLEKGLVKQFGTKAYPTMIVLDSAGSELQRIVDYQSSKQMLAILAAKP